MTRSAYKNFPTTTATMYWTFMNMHSRDPALLFLALGDQDLYLLLLSSSKEPYFPACTTTAADQDGSDLECKLTPAFLRFSDFIVSCWRLARYFVKFFVSDGRRRSHFQYELARHFTTCAPTKHSGPGYMVSSAVGQQSFRG